MITIVKRGKQNPTYTLMGTEEFVRQMKGEFPYMVRTNSTGVAIGRLLREKHYLYKKTSSCAMYLIKRRKLVSSIS